MLPSFLIIGAQKAATTWLATCLGEHPDVFVAPEKEIYFFNVCFDKGLAWYESHFGDGADRAAIGEATPGYISHPEAPSRIRAMLGDVKLIASLRHPVDRAYSAFWHYLRAGRIHPDTDFRVFFCQSDAFEIRSRGYYAVQLGRYLEHFAREDLLVLIYEEVFQDSQQAIADCFAFLGVDSQFRPHALAARIHVGSRDISLLNRQVHSLRSRLRRVVDADWVPPSVQKLVYKVGRRAFRKLAFEMGPKKKHFERLEDGLRRELLDEYIPDVKQLEELLVKDLSIWYGSSSAQRRTGCGGRGA